MEQTKRVLVVEDDLHIADLICLHLRDEQLEVVHCADGAEGMRLLQQARVPVYLVPIIPEGG